MDMETSNGSDGSYGRNDSNALYQPLSSTFSSQEKLNEFFEIMNQFNWKPLDVNFSNRRLDGYLFYYSSKL